MMTLIVIGMSGDDAGTLVAMVSSDSERSLVDDES